MQGFRFRFTARACLPLGIRVYMRFAYMCLYSMGPLWPEMGSSVGPLRPMCTLHRYYRRLNNYLYYFWWFLILFIG